MAKATLANLSNDELRAKLVTINTIFATTGGIFLVIILAWVLLGYWKTNIPMFISTMAVAIGTSASQLAIRAGLRSELKRRSDSVGETETQEKY